jgi:hypothetical protein
MRTYTILSEVHICRENVRSSAVLREISKGIGGGLCSYHSFAEEIFL